MREINIEELWDGYKGKPFNQMIKFHLKKQKNSDFYRQATLETIEMLPSSARHLAEGFIDRWSEAVYV